MHNTRPVNADVEPRHANFENYTVESWKEKGPATMVQH